MWILVVTGAQWRNHLWRRGGVDLHALALRWGGQVRPRWMGWRLRVGATEVEVFGGLGGTVTRVSVHRSRDTAYEEFPGILSSTAIEDTLRRLRGTG